MADIHRLKGSDFSPGLRLLFLIPLCLVLSCGAATATRSMFGGSLPFQVTVAPDANENSAIAVDLVVLYDAKLVEQLLKLKASDWFKQKNQFVRDHPNQVAVHGWEWVPSQAVKPQTISYGSGARKVVLFADYVSEGDHRATVDPQQSFRLLLQKIDFDVQVAK